MTRSLALWGLTLGVYLSGCAVEAERQDEPEVVRQDEPDEPSAEPGSDLSDDEENETLCTQLESHVEFRSAVEQVEQQGLSHSQAIAIGLLVKAGRLDSELARCQ